MTTGSTSPRSRWLGHAAFGIILLLGTIALPFWTAASEVRGDNEVTIASTETIDDDLFVFAGEFSLDGTATRDVFVSAGSVEVAGTIGGSLNAAAGNIEITGEVEGSVRVTGGRVDISGQVGGDLVVLGGTVTIDDAAVIEGDAQVYGGRLIADGTVRGDVGGSVGDVALDGIVGGNVEIDVQRLDVDATATIGGDLVYVSPSEADLAAGAQVGGLVDQQSVVPWGDGDGLRSRFFSPLARTVWMLITGALIIAVAPRLASALQDNTRKPVVAVIAGLFALVLIPLAAMLLAVSVVGIPASVILLVAFAIALYLSQFVVGQWIGSLLLPRSWNDGSRGYLLLSMTLGVIIIAILRFFLPVAWIAAFVNVVVMIVGLGAVVMLARQLRPWYVAGRVGA